MEASNGTSARGLAEKIWPWIVRVTGIGIAVYETLFEHVDRPTLLLLAAAMIGLPSFINIDRNRAEK